MARPKMTREQFLRRVLSLFPGRFKDLDDLIFVDTKTPTVFTCVYHGAYVAVPSAVLKSSSTFTPCCPECLRERDRQNGRAVAYDSPVRHHLERNDRELMESRRKRAVNCCWVKPKFRT